MTEKTKNGRPVVFWECNPDWDDLSYEDKDEAIEGYLDACDDSPMDQDGKITVYGFARMIAPAPTMADAVYLVDEFFDRHWEELQGDDTAPTTPDSTCEAALEFLTVLHRDFVPWACEQVTSEEVDVAEWIKANRPDWLEAE